MLTSHVAVGARWAGLRISLTAGLWRCSRYLESVEKQTNNKNIQQQFLLIREENGQTGSVTQKTFNLSLFTTVAKIKVSMKSQREPVNMNIIVTVCSIRVCTKQIYQSH